jgi:hypothetical protein
MIGNSESKLQNINQILIPSDPLILLASQSRQLSKGIDLILERFAQIQKKNNIISFSHSTTLLSSFSEPKTSPLGWSLISIAVLSINFIVVFGENSSVLMVELIQMQS